MRKSAPSPELAFGLRVRELRAVLPLTQEELAEATGLFRTYISRVEAGLANPTLRVIHKFAQALEVDVAALFEPATGVEKRVLSANPVSRGRVRR